MGRLALKLLKILAAEYALGLFLKVLLKKVPHRHVVHVRSAIEIARKLREHYQFSKNKK